jgi:hypothetical protein
MRKLALLAAALAAPALSGCAGLAFQARPVVGALSIYSKTNASEAVTQNAVGPKTGQSCATSVLGIVTQGDATVASAARAGGVKRIATVDHTFENIVGVYAVYCVVVTGE